MCRPIYRPSHPPLRHSLPPSRHLMYACPYEVRPYTPAPPADPVLETRHSRRLRGQPPPPPLPPPPYQHQPPNRDIWTTLPPELLVNITSFLPLSSLANLARVSRTFHNVAIGEFFRVAASDVAVTKHALYHAVQDSNISYMRQLLRYVTDQRVKTNTLTGVIDKAVTSRARRPRNNIPSHELLIALLDHGAHPTEYGHKLYRTPYVVQVLVAHPLAKDWINTRHVSYPLLNCAMYGSRQCLQLFLEHPETDFAVRQNMLVRCRARIEGGVYLHAAMSGFDNAALKIQMLADRGVKLDPETLRSYFKLNSEKPPNRNVVQKLVDVGVPVDREMVKDAVRRVLTVHGTGTAELRILWKAWGGPLDLELIETDNVGQGNKKAMARRNLLRKFWEGNTEEEVYEAAAKRLAKVQGD